jgi:oligopeptidase B
MQPTEALQASLYNEILARLQETDSSVPYRIGDFYYYWRAEAGRNYSIFCRKRGCLNAPEEVILDQNELAKEYNYFRLNLCIPSPDSRVLALFNRHQRCRTIYALLP